MITLTSILASLICLAIITTVIVISFSHSDPLAQHQLPKICIQVSNHTQLCYTCWKKSLSNDYNISPILLSTSPTFNHITFPQETNYSCDQLLQLIDQSVLLQSSTLKIQELSHTYKTMQMLQGRAQRQQLSQLVIDKDVEQLLVVQVIKNKEPNYVKTKSFSRGTYQLMVKFIKIIAVVALALRILLQLVKMYFQITFSFTFLLQIAIPLLFLWTLYHNHHSAFDFQLFLSTQLILFISVVCHLKDFKLFVPLLLFMYYVNSYTWILGIQLVFVIVLVTVQLSQASSLTTTIINAVFVSVILLIKNCSIYYLVPWQSYPLHILYPSILLLLPLLHQCSSIQHRINNIKQKKFTKIEQKTQDELTELTQL